VLGGHPLAGRTLVASWFKHIDGVLVLGVELPDGSAATVPAAVTDVFGTVLVQEQAPVLDAEGLRALTARLLESAGPARGGGPVTEAGGSGAEACRVRDVGLREALDAFGAALAASSARELAGGGDAGYYLRQVALQEVVAGRMRAGATVGIHRALVAGAGPAEVAHVLGVSVTQVADRWRAWAAGQRRLRDRCPGLGLGRDEYEQVAAVLAGDGGNGPGQFTGCSCPGGDAQVGSPHP
jgi:hypothetical protein